MVPIIRSSINNNSVLSESTSASGVKSYISVSSESSDDDNLSVEFHSSTLLSNTVVFSCIHVS